MGSAQRPNSEERANACHFPTQSSAEMKPIRPRMPTRPKPSRPSCDCTWTWTASLVSKTLRLRSYPSSPPPSSHPIKRRVYQNITNFVNDIKNNHQQFTATITNSARLDISLREEQRSVTFRAQTVTLARGGASVSLAASPKTPSPPIGLLEQGRSADAPIGRFVSTDAGFAAVWPSPPSGYPEIDGLSDSPIHIPVCHEVEAE